MPHNNRMSSSAALTTSAIWKNVIKYDPYAGSEEAGAGAAEEAAMLEQQQGLMDVVKIKARETLGVENKRGACRKCGNVGHLTYQCRNHLDGGLNRALGDSDSGSDSDSDDGSVDAGAAAARARAMAAAAASEGGSGSRKRGRDDEGSRGGSASSGGSSDGSESDSTTSSEEAARRRRRKEKKRRKKEEKKHRKKKVGVLGWVVWGYVCRVRGRRISLSGTQFRIHTHDKTGQEEAQEEAQKVKKAASGGPAAGPWRASDRVYSSAVA